MVPVTLLSLSSGKFGLYIDYYGILNWILKSTEFLMPAEYWFCGSN